MPYIRLSDSAERIAEAKRLSDGIGFVARSIFCAVTSFVFLLIGSLKWARADGIYTTEFATSVCILFAALILAALSGQMLLLCMKYVIDVFSSTYLFGRWVPKAIEPIINWIFFILAFALILAFFAGVFMGSREAALLATRNQISALTKKERLRVLNSPLRWILPREDE